MITTHQNMHRSDEHGLYFEAKHAFALVGTPIPMVLADDAKAGTLLTLNGRDYMVGWWEESGSCWVYPVVDWCRVVRRLNEVAVLECGCRVRWRIVAQFGDATAVTDTFRRREP